MAGIDIDKDGNRLCLVALAEPVVAEAERRIFYNLARKRSASMPDKALLSEKRLSEQEPIKIRFDNFDRVDYAQAKNYQIYGVNAKTLEPVYDRGITDKWDVVKMAFGQNLWWIWKPSDSDLLTNVVGMTEMPFDESWLPPETDSVLEKAKG